MVKRGMFVLLKMIMRNQGIREDAKQMYIRWTVVVKQWGGEWVMRRQRRLALMQYSSLGRSASNEDSLARW